MAANLKYSRLYDNVESLELTQEQEQELSRAWPVICRTASGFAGDDTLISVDDLIQESAVRVARAISKGTEFLATIKSRDAYYSTITRNTCITLIRNRRASHDLTASLDILEPFCTDSDYDEDRLHKRLYIDQLLDSIENPLNTQILLHYYGIDTPTLTPRHIAREIGGNRHSVYLRHQYTLGKLKQKISRGELPQWTTTN